MILRLKNQHNCPICNSTNKHVLIDEARDINHGNVPGLWTFWKCDYCKSIYLNPIIQQDDLLLAYSKYDTHAENDSIPFRKNGKEDFWHKIKLGYLYIRYGLNSGKKYYPYGFLMYLAPPYIRAEWDTHMMRIPKTKNHKLKLLDVGCGSGEFLKRARLCGWQVKGVDFDKVCIDIARKNGLDVIHGSINAIEKTERFDVITLSNVIEHVHNPMQLISQSIELLNTGGKLCILTPSCDGPGLRKWRENWTTLDTPRHLFILSKDSLKFISKEKNIKIKIKPRGWHLRHIDHKSGQIQNLFKNDSMWAALVWHFKELFSHFYLKYSDELFIEIVKR